MEARNLGYSTDSTKTALFKKYDGESRKLYYKIKMESAFF